ncbi:MAG: TerB family tellurite resistance protein [Alphaproteobacteria bacterium]|nr:TerB family tellurite resistance protein [Alphaproteobacteria bacterium]
MSGQVTDSQFYMWRTIFALAHADDIVTTEELRFMAEALEDIPFSDEQKETLQRDAKEEQSVEEMFKKITDPVDQAGFFKFASKIAHIDGDYGEEEQEVMLRLARIHLESVDIDELVGKVDLRFDEDNFTDPSPSFKNAVTSYRQKFLEKLRGH